MGDGLASRARRRMKRRRERGDEPEA